MDFDGDDMGGMGGAQFFNMSEGMPGGHTSFKFSSNGGGGMDPN